jgi:hypothetical protein
MLKQVLEIYDMLDSARITGAKVVQFLRSRGLDQMDVKTIKGKSGSTDFIKMKIPGTDGRTGGGEAPTIGIIGRLGGIGARPERIGMVSDADGAVTALACALKLADMQYRGDSLKGDVIVATHICPNAPILPHDPVPFMGSPVSMREMNEHEVDPEMDAILSIDTTRGNRLINHKGIALTPPVKEGYILKLSDDVLDILEWTSGKPVRIMPITTADITPYGNGLDHINSILQPCTATTSPVMGVTLTAETVVPGCGTGASQEADIRSAGVFCIEVAKAFTQGKCRFYDEAEFHRMVHLYGPMKILQTLGKA